MAEKLGIRPATIILKNNAILLVKSQYSKDPYYLFPGGGMHYGETLEDCAIRETFEETGVNVKILELFHVNEYIKDWDNRVVNIFFLAKFLSQDKPLTDDSGKILSVEWISIEDLDKYLVKPNKIISLLKKHIAGKIVEKYSIDSKIEI